MQRSHLGRRRRSRIPRLQGSLGDLRIHGDLAQSHDSGLSRSTSLASLLSAAAPVATSTALPGRRRAISRPDVLDEDGSVAGTLLGRRQSVDILEDIFQHEECRAEIAIYKSENEELKKELTIKQLEIDRLRMEIGAITARVPSPAPVIDVTPLVVMQLPHYLECAHENTNTDAEEELSELDDSILEFWNRCDTKFSDSKKLSIESMSFTPVIAMMKASKSEVWTMDKPQDLPSMKGSTSSQSLQSLNQMPDTKVLNSTQQKAHKSMTRQGADKWRPAINRPSKLNISRATEDAGIVKRLESPAAISLLSPRPFNKQNVLAQGQMVPPLDLHSLVSECSSSSAPKYFESQAPKDTEECRINHKLLQDSQNTAAQSRSLLKSLRKNFLPRK